MKCTCEQCGGSGRVQCDECDGTGNTGWSVEDFDDAPPMRKTHRHHDELSALKADLKRLRASHLELCKLNPARTRSYDDQLAGAIAAVERQAEKLWKDK